MENCGMVVDWIGEIAETAKTHDQRHRERERRKVQEAEAIAAHAQDFWESIVTTVERDLLRFQEAFPFDPDRSLKLDMTGPQAFQVIRTGCGVKLAVQAHASCRAIEFRYNPVAGDQSGTLKCSGILDMRADRNGDLYLSQYGRDFLSFDDISRMLLERIFRGVAIR